MNLSTCADCGNSVVLFRDSAGGVALTPMELPADPIPHRLRWTVNHGLAFLGWDKRAGGYCRLLHDDICPAREHPDLDEALVPLVRALRVRMRRMIDRGEFTPSRYPASPARAPEPAPAPAAAATTDSDAGAVRTTCAGADCSHATVASVAEGWLCWQCQRRWDRRQRTHRKWGAS